MAVLISVKFDSGVFDDTITDMSLELTNGTVPYLIPTPNSTNDVGYNRDRFLLNPDLTSSDDLMAFKFIGMFYICMYTFILCPSTCLINIGTGV